MIYHGVLRSCNGYVYSFGSAILDLEQPWKVKFRSGPYLLSPQKDYECMGDVPNVVFPCAALHDPETKRIAIYYGCADTVTGLAFGYIDEILDFYEEEFYHLQTREEQYTFVVETIYFYTRKYIVLEQKVYCFFIR